MARSHRSADTFALGAPQKQQERKRAKARLGDAAKCVVEHLEGRLLLASTPVTLDGNNPAMSNFVFINEDGNKQTVKAIGNIQATLVGANVDGSTNAVTLEDLPGEYVTPAGTTNVNGGFNIPGASTAGPPLTILPPSGPQLSQLPTALAIDASQNGDPLYVLQVVPTAAMGNNPATSSVYLYSIDKMTGASTYLSELSSEIVSASGQTGMNVTVNSVSAACFGPSPTGGNGSFVLYFVATVGAAAGGGGPGVVQKLYDVNVQAGSPALIAQTVQGVLGNFNNATGTITAICYDQVATKEDAGTPQLAYAIGTTVTDCNLDNTNVTNAATPAYTPNVGSNILGLICAPDPESNVLYIYAMTDANVYTINSQKYGRVTNNYGPLGPPLANPGDLAYDPSTMLGVTDDLTTGTLDTVSLLNRTRYLSLYQIYISSSDSTGEIVSYITDANGVDPYGSGISGGLSITNTSGKLVNIAAPANTGDALIGVRTRLIPGAPITQGDQPQGMEAVTANSSFGAADYTTGTSIKPGIVSAPGTTIGEIMIGGPVMGAVNLAGSINLFYCDWLLTGDVSGDFPNDVADPGNFAVAGDLGSLVVLTYIGEDTPGNFVAFFNDVGDYVTSFDMSVTGTVGEVNAYGSIYGDVSATQSATAPSLSAFTQTEDAPGEPLAFQNGVLNAGANAIAAAAFRNDSFDNPQYVGSLPATAGAAPSQTIVDGVLDADGVNLSFANYYGIALMAGQTVTAQVVDPFDALDCGVFNPEGAVVASDYNLVNTGYTEEQQFQFTAKEPGIYRFAVSLNNDLVFTDTGEATIPNMDYGYTLTVTGVGDLAVGAEAASTYIVGPQGGSSIVSDGDFGAVTTGDLTPATEAITGDNIEVDNGNLRDLDSGTVGVSPGDLDAPNPILSIPNGSVGYLGASSGTMIVDTPPAPAEAPTIGGSFQMISSAGDLLAELIANGNIGVVRASAITNDTAGFGFSIFEVDASENPATPGYIDMISDQGDWGTVTNGGPHLIIGPQGDAGYLMIGGTAYTDSTFGGGGNENTVYQPGESVTLTDDTGATVTISPTGVPGAVYPPPPASTGGGSSSGTSVNPTLPQLRITALGVEGTPGIEGAGVDIAEVESTGGVTINTGGSAPGQTVQIGKIVTAAVGTPLIQTPGPALTTTTTTSTTGSGAGSSGGSASGTSSSGQATYYPAPNSAGPVGRTVAIPEPPEVNPVSATATPYQVIIEGTARTDAYEVYAVDPANPEDFRPQDITTANAEIGEIVNDTPGDIGGIYAVSIGALTSDGQVGLTQSHTGVALDDGIVTDNVFPLVNEQNDVYIVGQTDGFMGAAIGSIDVPNGIGNFDVMGAVGPATTSILGPVEISNPMMPALASLYSLTLTSGGIAPSGSGEVSNAGLYVSGTVGAITNDAAMDIRGSLISTMGFNGFTLHNASIINAVIADYTPPPTASGEAMFNEGYENASLYGGDNLLTDYSTPITNPILDLGNITVVGNGGIIGTDFEATHIGKISVGGFGIFDTSIEQLGDGTITSISAAGYGVRAMSVTGGASVGSIQATGSGTNLSVTQYSADVQLSEHETMDPYFGFAPNGLTDIDAYLGTTASAPQNGDTVSGLIEDSSFVGSRDLGAVHAYLITGTATLPTNFEYADAIGTFTTRSDIDYTDVTTGRITSFAPGGNLNSFFLTVSGAIHALSLKGNVTSGSEIVANGINGNIGTVKIAGNMDGAIVAARGLTSLIVNGNLTGTVTAPKIGRLQVGGMINGGNLVINGNLGVLQTAGDLAVSGESVMVKGNLATVKIGGNLNVNLTVTGNLGTLKVGKSVLSGTTTDVGGVLNSLLVDGDVQTGATITAAVIHRKKVKGLIQGVIS